jgi:hypothetical protein
VVHVRKRIVAPMLACLALAVPASASAHARTPTVALDYKLVLDERSRSLEGARVAILDGDRSLRIGVRTARVEVLGDLNEPMLRISHEGAWANRSSPTAVAARLVRNGRGWQQVGGSTYTWHDHRLAPPPYRDGRAGVVASFHVPIRVDGQRTMIAGSFVRYRRPSAWPWILGAAVGVAAALTASRRLSHARAAITIGLGCTAGLAAIASLASFGAADSPSGRVGWVQLGLAAVVGAMAAVALRRLRGEGRVVLAALIGAAAAATVLGSLGVFRHAVVISSFSPMVARLLCALAFTAGVAGASTGLLMRGAQR